MTDRAAGRPGTLVLGVGNILYSDEGVGVAAAVALAARGVPGVEVLDGGTLGLSLYAQVDGRDSLLIFDALAGSDDPPGTVLVLGHEAVSHGMRLCLSVHQLGVSELLATVALAGRPPARVAAVAMVPASLELGLGLSPVAGAALGNMVTQGLAVLAGWGLGGDA